MAMNKPYLIRDNIYCIEHIMSFGIVRSFLIIGKDKALLVDTGLGRDDLKAMVETLTSVPIVVIYTHSDGDHVGGANQFGISYMHPIEIKHYKKRFENPHEMKEINEADLLDCGNYQFEIIHIPGHTPGSIGLYEKNQRFMIGGDSIQEGPIFMFGDGRDLNDYLSTLKKVQNLKQLDIIYTSHNELIFKKENIQELIDATQKLINGDLEGFPEERFENKVKKYIYKNVSLYAK